MATGDRGASVNRAQPRKAKRVAQPKVNLAGISGSGSAKTGASSSAPAQKPVVARPVRGVQGGGRAGAGVTATAKVPTKKPVARRVEQAAKNAVSDAVNNTIGMTIPGGRLKPTQSIVKGAAAQVPELAKAAGTGIKAQQQAKARSGAVSSSRGPMGLAMVGSTGVNNPKALKASLTVVKNAPKDAADIAASTPSSLYYLGKTAVTDPGKTPEMTAEPYKQFFKDPGKFASEKPVSTALMFVPPTKGASLGAGRVARQAGKQTLDGGVRGVKGFAVEQPITRPRGLVGNAVAARKAKSGPTVAPKTKVRKLDPNRGIVKRSVSSVAATPQAVRNTRAVSKSKYSPQTPLTEFEQAKLVDKWEGYKNRTQQEFSQAAAQRVRDENPLPKRREVGRKARKVAKQERIQKVDAATKQAFEDAGKALDREFVQRFGATGRPTGPADAVSAAAKARRTAELERATTREAREAARAVARKARIKRGDKRGVPPKEADTMLKAEYVDSLAVKRLEAAKQAEADAVAAFRADKKGRKAATLTDHQTQGRVFESESVAKHVAKLSESPAKVVKVGDQGWGVVPATMRAQRKQHMVVGTSKATGSVALRKLRKSFTQTVLPYRPAKWLTGQAVEPAVRAAASGVRPGDGARLRYFVDALNKRQPGLGDAFRRDTLTGGQGGLMRELDQIDNPTLAEVAKNSERIHEGSRTHSAMTKLSSAAASKPVKAVKSGHDWYVDQVFRNINSRGLERPWQDAFGGAALRQIPELERKLGKGGRGNRKTLDRLADQMAKDPKALHRASQRIQEQVNYDYGKYADFTPGRREAQMHWAPFMPWAVNAAKWTPTVPFKRPVVGMTVSTAHNASEDWRAKHGLSSYKGSARPAWQRSAIPFKEGTTINVGKYGPWGITADPVNTAGGQLLPFIAPAWASMMYGIDWKGQKIYGKDGEPLPPEKRLAYALAQAGKANLGPLGTIDDLGNYTDRAITGRDKKGTVLENLESQFNILKSLEKSAKQSEANKKKRKAKRKAGSGPTREDIEDILRGPGTVGPSKADVDAILNGGN